jgi:FkbM family methyltransferase
VIYTTELPHYETLLLDSEIALVLPNHPIASSEFRNMAAENWEWKDFLNTAQGCCSLVDVGASAGFFSALFAATRGTSSRILSIECDRTTLPVLEEVRTLNRKPHTEWVIDGRGVSDTRAFLGVVSTGYGAAVADQWSRPLACSAARSNGFVPEEYAVQCDRLSNICRGYKFAPDLLKIDVESYEYEVILSSEKMISQYKPQIHLELHLDLLRQRRKDPKDIMRSLERIGYRSTGSNAPLLAIEKARSGTLRVGLTTK